MTDYSGELFNKKYRLVERKGSGNFADVYRGERVTDHVRVAVKVFRAPLVNGNLQKFVDEAGMLKLLRNKYIIPLIEVGLAENQIPYLVMTYAPHGSLRDRHPRGSCLPLDIVISYVKPIASALQYAHDREVIHRDIKPENLLLGPHYEILLGDFGIATLTRSMETREIQEHGGTPIYMAPEQFEGNPSRKSDQYALGIIVYEWLCGTPPFEGNTLALAYQHKSTPPLPLHTKISSIPSEVEQVIMKALRKDPNRRFESVQAFATALEGAYQRSLPPPNPVQKSEQPTSRRSLLLGSLAGLTLGSAVGSSITWFVTSHNAMSGSSLPSPTHPPTLISLSQGTPIYTYVASAGPATTVAWSPNGKRIACGFWGIFHTAEVLDAAEKNLLFTYVSHNASVWRVAWSYDSKSIASGSDDGTVRVWDAVIGVDRFVYNYHGGVYAVAWSPKEMRIASGGTDHKVQVWDAKDGGNPVTYSGHTDTVLAVAWSPNGKWIASTSRDRTAQVWDAVSGTRISIYSGHADYVHDLSWSPDGTLIASGSLDETVKIWNATSGQNVLTYSRHNRQVSSVAWSPDGKWIASAAGPDVHIWDARNGGHIYIYTGHSSDVGSVTWSPDSLRVASSDQFSTIQVWQAV